MKPLLLALVALLALPLAARADPASPPTFQDAAKTFDAAFAKNDCDLGMPATRQLTADPAFAALPAAAKDKVWGFAVTCDTRRKDVANLFDDVRQGTQLPDSLSWFWLRRLDAGGLLGKTDDVVDTTEHLASADPASLNLIHSDFFVRFRAAALAAGRADAATRVLAALERANYQPQTVDPESDASGLWLDAARGEADTGRLDHASALLGRITAPEALIGARLDQRFTALVAADPARFDLKAAAERQLAVDRAVLLGHPKLLAAAREVGVDLRMLERFDEALALIQTDLDNVAKAPPDAPAYSDEARELNWLHNDLAETLFAAGRRDEAIAAMRDAAALQERGLDDNISQTINLAGMLMIAGRDQDALATLAPFDKGLQVTAYGLGWVRADHACALVGLRRAADVADDMAWVTAHQRDNPAARVRALMCAGTLDDLAAELIAELGDSDQREAALVNLSLFDPPPPAYITPRIAADDALWTALRARPDVQAAIARAGHTERIPLCACAFQDAY